MSERYAPLRIQPRPGRPHDFDGDPSQGVDWRTKEPTHCSCGMPRSNRVHDEQAIASASARVQDALAEERRRLGERED